MVMNDFFIGIWVVWHSGSLLRDYLVGLQLKREWWLEHRVTRGLDHSATSAIFAMNGWISSRVRKGILGNSCMTGPVPKGRRLFSESPCPGRNGPLIRIVPAVLLFFLTSTPSAEIWVLIENSRQGLINHTLTEVGISPILGQ